MLKVKGLLIIFCLGSALPCFAQQNKDTPAPPPPPREVTGVVQSYSGNTLDIKPANGPSVWVTIPDSIKVKPEMAKPGAMVSVEARWDGNDLLATGSPKEGKEK